MKKNKKTLIIVGTIILLLVIFIGILQIVSKRNKYTYLCFKNSVSKDEVVYNNMLKECYTNKELKNNVLTREMLDFYGLKILDKYDDNQTIYYLKENKEKNEQISVEEIYWKLEEFTEKDIISQVGDKYRIYISDDSLYIYDEKKDESTKIFNDVPVKSFTMQPDGGDGNYKLIIHTIYDTVCISKQTKDEILGDLENKTSDFSFDSINLQNINSFIVTNIVPSLNGHKIYAVDKEGTKYDIE